MIKTKTVWMPHPGHFVCANDCRFHLNTYVNGYIVSTVGEYWPDSSVRRLHAQLNDIVIKGEGDDWDRNYFKKFGYEEIGAGRKYETMVFKAVMVKNTCCPYRANHDKMFDFSGYNDAEAAYLGHMKMIRKWSKKKTKKK